MNLAAALEIALMDAQLARTNLERQMLALQQENEALKAKLSAMSPPPADGSDG